jgi:hypothetical protein
MPPTSNGGSLAVAVGPVTQSPTHRIARSTTKCPPHHRSHQGRHGNERRMSDLTAKRIEWAESVVVCQATALRVPPKTRRAASGKRERLLHRR